MKITEATLRRLIKKVISEIYTSSDDVSDRPSFFQSSGKDQAGVTYSKVCDMLKQWYRNYNFGSIGSFARYESNRGTTYDFRAIDEDKLEIVSDLFDNVVSLISGNIQRPVTIDHACAEVFDNMTEMGPPDSISDKDLEKCAFMLCVRIVESFMPADLVQDISKLSKKSIEDTIKFDDDLKNIADVYIRRLTLQN